jgi:hypothetical protein
MMAACPLFTNVSNIRTRNLGLFAFTAQHDTVATSPVSISVEFWNKDCDEECRRLGYNTAVRTSQETHYFSATESSLLMLCKI